MEGRKTMHLTILLYRWSDTISSKGVNPKPEHPFIHPIVQVRILITL